MGLKNCGLKDKLRLDKILPCVFTLIARNSSKMIISQSPDFSRKNKFSSKYKQFCQLSCY